MKWSLITILFLLVHTKENYLKAQVNSALTIDSCLFKARENYPLIYQYQLIKQSYEYSLSNAAKGYLPQFLLYGQATYQSDVPNVPTGVPGVFKSMLDKDQFKAYGEINQSLYDGGVIRNQRNIQSSQSDIDQRKVDVDLYALKDRVNQLFFGILLLDEQLKQNEIYKSDIQNGLNRIEAMVKDGAALKSNEDVLQADYLKADQKTTELKALRLAFLQMLSAFMGQKLELNTVLLQPNNLILTNEIKRPELALFNSQRRLVEAQTGLLNARNIPKLNLFLQGGYAKPGFDFFKNEFVWYYIGGVRLNWNFSGYYTLGKEKKILGLNAKMISVQQETFLFNTNNLLLQQNAEMEKYQALMKSDDEIVVLRKRIKERSLWQLENGVIQASDFMREVNAADLAQQNKVLHQIQYLQTQYNQKNTRGN